MPAPVGTPPTAEALRARGVDVNIDAHPLSTGKAAAHHRTRGRRIVKHIAGIALIVGVAIGGVGATATAEQAGWIRTVGTSCASQSGYISFNRFIGANCYTNRAYGADSFLRSSGYDVFLDGYFVGSLDGTATNTFQIYNRWSINVSVCRYANYNNLRNLLAPGVAVSVAGPTGLLSYRGSGCT